MALEPATIANSGPMALSFDTTRDVLATLPPNAADRLRRLRQNVNDWHSLVPLAEDRIGAGNSRMAAERHLTRLTDHNQRGGFGLKDDDPSVKAARLQLAALADEAKRLDALSGAVTVMASCIRRAHCR